MAKVSIIPFEKARQAPPPPTFSGSEEARTYFDGNSPLHLHLLNIDRGRTLRVGDSAIDRVIYIWRGAVTALGHVLKQGSSIIVEHGRTLAIQAEDERSVALAFAAANASQQSRQGGRIHLLPEQRIPRTKDEGQVSGVSGGMHADAECPSCEVWLHENSFPGQLTVAPEEQARGVHSHTQDEIIFVTDGEIRLGTSVYGPGTALAIAANTFYGFTAGPAGLRFVNFRTRAPGDIRFANGGSMSETAYWRERLSRPEYVNA